MKDIIQLLPDSVANQIAAGEVIQRPASVIKELVENAVDAGATVIDVLVTDAGRTSIQVIDNGKGMSATDARLSFERHATSKIRHADDLFSLHTMGFRGEALASIAAVAQVELKTKPEDQELGTMITIEGSQVTGQEVVACPTGSNFMVKNLFYNVPARRKFLKSNSTELNNIVSAFQRIALVYPHIAFSLHSNDTELFRLKSGNLRQRIIDIFGKRLNQDLLPLSVETSICTIHGFVGKPESARKKGSHQYMFVNGRYMKHPYFHKAVINAYERLVPTGEQPPYFIYFDVDAETIDVNIHPTKTEIKFENEQTVWQILFAGVREAVGLFSEIPSIEFDTEGKPDIPVFTNNTQPNEAPRVKINPDYNPFKVTPTKTTAPQNWEKLYDHIEFPDTEEIDTPLPLFPQQTPETAPEETILTEIAPKHYQYKGKYLITAVKSGLMIIDQHRAHVRILYEKYLRRLTEEKSSSQKVIFPEVIHFTQEEMITLQQIMPEIQAFGFELSSLGGNDFAIQATPSDIAGVNSIQLLHDMLAEGHETPNLSKHAIHQNVALTMALHAAIPYGQVLRDEEMETIINELFACTNAKYTPGGKSILTILEEDKMDEMFQ